MKKKLSSMTVSNYINSLEISIRNCHSTALIEKDRMLLNELYEILNKIKPTGDDNRHDLWLYALNDRKKKVWFSLCTVEYKEFKSVWLGSKRIIEINPNQKEGWPYKMTNLLEWLIESVKEVIEMLKDGTYNTFIEENLPYKYRQGSISRKTYYEMYPDEVPDYEGCLTKDEIDEFSKVASQFGFSEDGSIESDFTLLAMTSGKFFEICSYGYKENKMKGYETLPPLELYKRFADNRDGGLTKIDMDSEKDFLLWYSKNDKDKWEEGENPSHTWEVMAGGSRTRAHLVLRKKEKGWNLSLSGSRTYCTEELVRFYLGLVHNGIYPSFYGAKELLSKVLLEDKLGIVGEEGSTLAYAYGGFPDEDINNFIYMPERKKKLFINNATWYELEKIELQEK